MLTAEHYQTLKYANLKPWYQPEPEPHPLTNGLMSHWLLGEGYGAIAVDLTRNRNYGTLSGFAAYPWIGSHHGGMALNFPGASARVYTNKNWGNGSAFVSFSTVIWFNTTSRAGRKMLGAEDQQNGTSAAAFDRELYINTSGKVVANIFDNTAGAPKYATSANAFDNGLWHMAALTCTGTSFTLYVDGKAEATTTVGSMFSAYGAFYWCLGAYKLTGHTGGGDGYFVGMLEGARVYNRTLGPGEIAWLYQEPYAGFVGHEDFLFDNVFSQSILYFPPAPPVPRAKFKKVRRKGRPKRSTAIILTPAASAIYTVPEKRRAKRPKPKRKIRTARKLSIIRRGRRRAFLLD